MQPQRNWRDLIKPTRLEVDPKSLTGTYGKFAGEPFERGFGLTVGNSLRRIPLSSLQGAAITGVRIKGVLHEFSTITGVREDVTDIILNLKEVRVKLHDKLQDTARIEAKGEGEITAADIQANPNIEILNPDQHIASLSKEGKLDVDHPDRCHLLSHPEGQLHGDQRARRPAHRLRPPLDGGVDRR